MIKAVLFDLDGTLINTNELIIESFKHTYKKHLNLEVEAEEICRYFGEPLFITMRRYDEKNTEELVKTFHEYNERMHDTMARGFEGAGEIILKLREAGIKVGVVTSKRRMMTQRGLGLIGIDKVMDVVITPEDTEKHKPHPEPLLKACEVLGISPSEVLYVGDTIFDFECGRGAGTKCGIVKYTTLPMEKLMELKPDFIIEKLADIYKIVSDENSTNFAS